MKSDSREKKKCNLEHNELSKGMMSLDFENALIVNDKQENIIKNEVPVFHYNVKAPTVLNSKSDKSEENSKKKPLVYLVFLFNKVLSIDSDGIINKDFDKFVSCDLSSFVFWFDEHFIYVSRKESGGHKIYYKILIDTISRQFKKQLLLLYSIHYTFFQFSVESFFLQEYIISRKATNFSNFKEEVLLEGLLIIIKRYSADYNYILKYKEKNNNLPQPENEESIFDSPKIRDVYYYLLSKGFKVRSVLNCIKELSPNDYYAEINKIENLLSEDAHLHNLPQD